MRNHTGFGKSSLFHQKLRNGLYPRMEVLQFVIGIGTFLHLTYVLYINIKWLSQFNKLKRPCG